MIHFDIQGTALFFQRKSCAVSEKSCIFGRAQLLQWLKGLGFDL